MTMALFAGLIIAIGIQIRDRLIGTLVVIGLCFAIEVYGFWLIDHNLPLRFFILESHPATWTTVMAAVVIYQIKKLISEIRIRQNLRSGHGAAFSNSAPNPS